MSHQVTINYEAIAIECQSICLIASKQLCQIQVILKKIDDNATSLQSEETTEMKKDLLSRARAIRTKISEIETKSNAVASRGVVIADSDYIKGTDDSSIAHLARALSIEVDEFTINEISAYEVLLDRLLEQKVSEHYNDMQLRAKGTATYNAQFANELEKVGDKKLRAFIYLEWLNNLNIGKPFVELKQIAVKKMSGDVDNLIARNIIEELKIARIDEDKIKSVMEAGSIQEIRRQATKELVGEEVRKRTLKVVTECIENKGFVVDRKNIKLQKDKNEVVMIAQKASGEKAEFRIMLDGKFAYHFNGYEGQACQNDIKPFMQDLEDIYGVKVVSSQEIWKNPDKISSQKYQQINARNNKE